MEEEEHSSPFWLQTTGSRRRPQRSQVSSLFLGSGVFLIVFVVIGIFFLLVIIPSFVSFTSQIFRPQHIKRSWDSLNFVLVLFAIICGFLSRSNNSSSNGSTSYYEDRSLSDVQLNVQKPYPSTPRTWNEYPQDRPTHSSTLTRLRSFGSYPDLRQESLERWRFYDDTYLNNYRVSSFDQLYHDRPQQQQQEEEPKKQQEDDIGTTDIAVDAFTATQLSVSASAPPPPPPEPSSSPPPPPSPPQPARSKVGRGKVKRTYQDPGNGKRSEEERLVETGNFYIPPTSPLPPPSPPPPPPVTRRRGKDFLASLRRRRKRQRQKSVENIDWLFNPEPESSLSFLPPPPPPPPPPPHIFQNIFSSRKSKIKKIHSVPPPPPPPPTLVTSSVSKSASKNVIKPLEGRAFKTNVQVAQAVAHKPSKPITTSSLSNVEKNLYSGNPSPSIPIPPPPPPPPFRIRSWKFVFDGDNVRVGSFNSSRSGSPDLDSLEDAAPDRESSPVAAVKEVGDFVAAPSFCPSPDVNVKADNFIARFRDGLKLEKIDSLKGRSNLGPEASTS